MPLLRRHTLLTKGCTMDGEDVVVEATPEETTEVV